MNEPVAWMLTLPDGTHDWILDGNGCEGYIPLYTHPVKEQDESFDRTASHMAGEYVSYKAELTDEKITAIAKEIFKDYKNFHHYQIDFARAVIKEVSGK